MFPAPDIDPIIGLTFALTGRPGAYAVLVGSGLSTSAGIPTGWQILLDLIRRVAALDREDPGDSPDEWFVRRTGHAPTYSELLRTLGATPAERQAILRGYIEASTEHGDERRPTAAHRALARLAAAGYVKVILTTNFDRLIEQALTEAGVTYTVLATADSVAGALPLVHSGVVVIKLNGDYLDPGIKNTEVELDSYDVSVEQLVDQVLDQYGLIVCGWSATHDGALRRAVERCTNRRFSCYWALRGTPTPEAEELIQLRQAEVVHISDADKFFGQLADACDGLMDFHQTHPLTVVADVATAKRELASDRRPIVVHDRLRAEIERVRRLPIYTDPKYSGVDHLHVVAQLEADLERLLALTATLAYWGDSGTDQWWIPDIGRFGERPYAGGEVRLIDLVRIPGMMLLWTGGVAAVASYRSELLVALLTVPQSTPSYSSSNEQVPASISLTPEVLHVGDDAKRVYRVLKPIFVEHLGIGMDAFIEAWESWQYLLLALGWDARLTNNQTVGNFSPHIRVDTFQTQTPVPALLFRRSLERDGERHKLLAAGLFGGSVERMRTALDHTDESYGKRAEDADWSLLAPTGSGSLPTGRHYPGSFSADPDE